MNSTLTVALLLVAVCGILAQKNIMKQAVGPCIDDACPMPAHTCYYGQCVPTSLKVKMQLPKKAEAIGPCLNGLCPTPKSYCYKSECYPEPKNLYD
ncbi:unnamed protein product, partial [Mesorhabditis spiculigera]